VPKTFPPAPPTASAQLTEVWRAWELSAALHSSEDPPPSEAVGAAEAQLGRTLPADLRALYEASDGLYLLQGDLTISPVASGDDDFRLARQTAALREWEWPIHQDAVVFATDGGGDPFALWLPTGADPELAPVVHIGQDFDADPALGIAGITFTSFLRARTAAYLLIHDAPPAALDALGVPGELRAASASGSDEGVDAVLRWADPGLVGMPLSPYDAEALRADAVALRFSQKS
jgi:cell wall assembly regulator SMI1